MSRAPLIATSALVGAAIGAVLVMFVPSVREGELESRLADMEDELADARRDASDWERVAAAERERKRVLEEDVASLRVAVGNLPSAGEANAGAGAGGEGAGGANDGGMAGGMRPHSGHGEPEERDALDPAIWDGQRLRIELERLSMRGRRMAQSPLLDACATAAAAQGDPALEMLLGTLQEAGLPARLRLAATMVLEKLADERAVPVLLETLPTASDWAQRRAILRALANLPGDAQVQTFVEIWDAADTDARMRMVAVHALAQRGHAIAVDVVSGADPVTDQALRARAIDSLHGYVRVDAYRKHDLIPTFGAALTTAAGEGQIRAALLALEGYWHPDCVPYLRALEHAQNVAPELTARGKQAADAIEANDPRPEGAGVAKAARTVPVDEE